MIAAFCSRAGAFELRDIARPVPGTGEVLIRVRSCGICGSDLHFFQGGVPPPRVCPGHEMSGEVAAVGPGGEAFRPGDRVTIEPLVVCQRCAYCRTGNYQLCTRLRLVGTLLNGGFAEYVCMPAYTLFKLPGEVDYALGALAEPLAVALHAIRLARVRLGNRVLVLGAGTIGLLAVAAARSAGAAEIWTTARHPHQAHAAQSLGATQVFTGSDASTAVSAAAMEFPIDVVVETVGGTADTINQALHLVRPGGTVAVIGIFTAASALDALCLVVKEIRVIGSLTYGRAGRYADFDLALQLLAAEPERFHQLLTHTVPLSAITRGFEIASTKRGGAIKVVVQPD